MTLPSFGLDFQPMFAQSDWLIGQLTVGEILCSANSITQPLKRKDTLDIEGLTMDAGLFGLEESCSLVQSQGNILLSRRL